MSKKLFGGSGKGRFAAKNTDVSIMADEPEMQEAALAARSRRGKPRKTRRNRGLKAATVLLSVLLAIESAYCVVIFTDWIPPLAALRSIYIDTAMITMRHQWLATALIPGDVVMDVVRRTEHAMEQQQGLVSGWGDLEKPSEPAGSPSTEFDKDAAAGVLGQLSQDVSGEEAFFERFHELDAESVRAYVSVHPETVENGWDSFYVNEAGLNDYGTDMMTKQGDQVLAIDASNGLLVVRVKGSTYKGVLIIGKDASRLMCAPAESSGVGQYVGEITAGVNGLVGMTGSGFEDLPGQAEGSHQTGAAMCSGEIRGSHTWGVKRIELHLDNRLYIRDSESEFSEGCTDATEWTPALIVDGVNVSGQDYTYTALNPRTCLGQTRDESILFLAIEGRKLDSMGCNAQECAEILMRYDGYQAMNVDGGTSSMLWYQGEPVIRCSNSDLPQGRRLPNAWVYASAPVPNP